MLAQDMPDEPENTDQHCQHHHFPSEPAMLAPEDTLNQLQGANRRIKRMRVLLTILSGEWRTTSTPDTQERQVPEDMPSQKPQLQDQRTP
jgi:hypothetical protein